MENSELETLKIKYDELAKQLEGRGVSFDHHTAVKTMMEMKLTQLRADLDLAIEALKNIQCDKVNGHTDECRIATRTLAKLQERK